MEAAALQRHHKAAARQALEDPRYRQWNQPVVDLGGRERTVVVEWQPWMGSWPRLLTLLDSAEDAGHGIVREGGKSLRELNMEIAQILCSGPEGPGFMWRRIDEDSAKEGPPATQLP